MIYGRESTFRLAHCFYGLRLNLQQGRIIYQEVIDYFHIVRIHRPDSQSHFQWRQTGVGRRCLAGMKIPRREGIGHQSNLCIEKCSQTCLLYLICNFNQSEIVLQHSLMFADVVTIITMQSAQRNTIWHITLKLRCTIPRPLDVYLNRCIWDPIDLQDQLTYCHIVPTAAFNEATSCKAFGYCDYATGSQIRQNMCAGLCRSDITTVLP